MAGQEPFALVRETHSAAVFFLGDRAFKVKKPVDLGFLDFTTLQAREAACRRETELNRRFAPREYLGVARVNDASDRPCEFLVVMRRMPADRRLADLVRDGTGVDDALRRVARQLAAVHAASPRRPEITAQGSRDAVGLRWRDNLDGARSCSSARPGEPMIGEIERLALRFLAGREPLFAARMRDGRIVDGHGDLLADDIFCLPDGPRILDCLDFDDRLRWLDGLDDACFLAMDLDRLQVPRLGERFLSWYQEFAGDPAPAGLCQHYIAYRAFVRAKVSWLAADQGQAEAAARAHDMAALALRHLRAGTVSLVLVGGLPGTGKSTLSHALAERLGWPVLDSDRVRKELAGIAPEEPAPAAYGAGIYQPAWTLRTYRELLTRIARLLALGESVIVDASWTSASMRAAARAAASAAHADVVQLRCVAPGQVAATRLRNRPPGTSDADPDVAVRMAAEQDAWPDATTIDTTGPDTARTALDAIRPHGPAHAWRPSRPYMLPG